MKLEMLNKTNRFDHNHNYFLSLTNLFSKVKEKTSIICIILKTKIFYQKLISQIIFHIYQGHYLA